MSFLFQSDDFVDIALTSWEWSTRGTLSDAARALARQACNLALSLADEDPPAPQALFALNAMVCKVCKEVAQDRCSAYPMDFSARRPCSGRPGVPSMASAVPCKISSVGSLASRSSVPQSC